MRDLFLDDAEGLDRELILGTTDEYIKRLALHHAIEGIFDEDGGAVDEPVVAVREGFLFLFRAHGCIVHDR